MLFQGRPERLMVAMKSRRVEPAIGLDAPAVLAKFNDIVSQLTSPGNEKADQSASKGQTPRTNAGSNRPMNDLSLQLQCGRY
jgi:hypothetical protein